MADSYTGGVHIADIIEPSTFKKYVAEKTATKSAIVQSGIVNHDPTFDALAINGGRTINMPFFTDLTGDDEILSDSGALTPGKIGTAQDIAVLHGRGRAWGVNDLAKALSGDDPMGAIVDLVASYWARKEQTLLLNTLNGVFSAATMADNLYTATDAISGEVILDGMQKLGDSADKLTAMAMSSAVYTQMKKLNLIDAVPDARGEVNFYTYMGKPIIIDDSLVAEGANYPIYLFGEGAFAKGEGAAPVPVETDRDSLAGEDLLITRRHFILHPRGVKWVGTPAATFPTNDECAVGTNWTRVYEKKNVRMVKILAPLVDTP
jgi:hypothetical protein